MEDVQDMTTAVDHWQILFHEAMAALLRAQEAVKRQLGLWGLLNGLWRCGRDLKAFNAALKQLSELPDGILSEEFVRSQIPQLRKILRSIDELMDRAKRRQLTNRSLVASALGSIRIRGDYIVDFVDALEMSIDPEVLKAINEGREQIDRGEYEIVERLF